MKYFEGILMVLGWLVLVFLAYMALHALCMKIDKKIQQKRKLKTLEGKIDKINGLIKEIQWESNKTITGKAYNTEMTSWIYLHELQKVELSDKN